MKKEIASPLFFDIEGAFDKVKTSNICEALHDGDSANQLVSWVKSKMTSRRQSASIQIAKHH